MNLNPETLRLLGEQHKIAAAAHTKIAEALLALAVEPPQTELPLVTKATTVEVAPEAP